VPSDSEESSRSNGLGLSIAKSLIEAQGGSIHIESTPGKGTVVSLLMHTASVRSFPKDTIVST
jgi:signal transduction histidine kinase